MSAAVGLPVMLERCSALVRDAKATAGYWDQIREQIAGCREVVRVDVPHTQAAQPGAATGDAQKDQEIAELRRKLEAAERRCADIDIREREVVRKEEKLSQMRARVKEDRAKLEGHLARLDIAKARIEQREDHVRQRESEMSSTIDYFTTQLAPSEKRPRVSSVRYNRAESFAPPASRSRRAGKRRPLDSPEHEPRAKSKLTIQLDPPSERRTQCPLDVADDDDDDVIPRAASKRRR